MDKGRRLGRGVEERIVAAATHNALFTAFELLLGAAGHDLIVKNTRTRGYRDIDILVATAVQSDRDATQVMVCAPPRGWI